MQLFWHRRDLRTVDNRGLAAAAEADDGPVVALFVLDPIVLDHAAPPRVAFLLDALSALRESYRERGSDLAIERGDPSAVVPAVAEGIDADRVIWNEDYSGLARERDQAVRAALADRGIEHDSYRDAVLHHPDEIRTNAGDPYQVYTYYWKKWVDRDKTEPAPAPGPEALLAAEESPEGVSNEEATGDGAPGGVSSGEATGDEIPAGFGASIPSLSELGFDEPEATIPDAGHGPARELLEAFCDGPIYSYEEDREYPAREGTSRLSPHLKYGTIGVREVWAATVDAAEHAPDESARENVREYQSQLGWREFYTQVLYHNPEVVGANYRDYENPIDWREDPDILQAWKDGETGYPIVDAGMRQLRAEAYMHNRVRMIVASFLTKDLLLDWRAGYAWFREKLVDHDTANDNGGWQWAASTGTDAQPYFRIFNPMTQGERYDPEATYITEYVPELAGVDPAEIHAWHELDPTRREELAPEYPDPIVDHSQRREEALAMFERARGEDD